MNEIKDCIDALLAAVQNSEEYQEFINVRILSSTITKLLPPAPHLPQEYP